MSSFYTTKTKEGPFDTCNETKRKKRGKRIEMGSKNEDSNHSANSLRDREQQRELALCITAAVTVVTSSDVSDFLRNIKFFFSVNAGPVSKSVHCDLGYLLPDSDIP